tara:strand:- start:3 stop:191 length:189 start_codon:yes stop_codon:yes gene_type:complete
METDPKYFDSKRAKKYLDIINSINEKAEKRIENIRKKRDEQVNFYDSLFITEKAKPRKKESA